MEDECDPYQQRLSESFKVQVKAKLPNTRIGVKTTVFGLKNCSGVQYISTFKTDFSYIPSVVITID